MATIHRFSNKAIRVVDRNIIITYWYKSLSVFSTELKNFSLKKNAAVHQLYKLDASFSVIYGG